MRHNRALLPLFQSSPFVACNPGAACSLRSHLPLATLCRAYGVQILCYLYATLINFAVSYRPENFLRARECFASTFSPVFAEEAVMPH